MLALAMLRLFVVGALLMACSGTAPEPTDAALFEVRDAVVDPRDAADATTPDATDVQVTVDVVVYDGPSDAAVSDAVAPDIVAADATADLAAPGDVVAPTCADLAERYAATVREAQRCTADVQCGFQVCETLCCTCDVFVAAMGDTAGVLQEIQRRSAVLGCRETLRCSDVRCEVPRGGACSMDGRCVTLRVAPTDAAVDR